MSRLGWLRLAVWLCSFVTLTSCGMPRMFAPSDGYTIVLGEEEVGGSDGEIHGAVVDNQGAALPGVTVTISGRHIPTRVFVTDVDGRFRFFNLAPGEVTVTAELYGFGSANRMIEVRAGIRQTIVQEISPALEQAITVTAQTPVLDVRRVGTGATFTMSNRPAPRSSRRGVPSRSAPVAIPASSSQVPTATSVVPEVVGTEEYAPIVSNAFEKTEENAISTFSIDVDRASYSNVRRFIRSGELPPPDAVRIEELVNYFTYDDPTPDDGDLFVVTTEVSSCPWNQGSRLVRIGIRAKEIEPWEAAPHNLVFLLDVSGSMEPPQRLPLLKKAFELLVDQLRGDDTVAIVTYAQHAKVVLPPTAGTQKAAIMAAIEGLVAEGSTAGEDGLRLAYDVVRANYRKAGNNRIILATDGDFNLGISSVSELERFIEEQRDDGIFLSVLGVGTGNYKDARVEILADKGNGNYAYIDSLLEAKKVLVGELGGTLQAIARDVKIQVEFDPGRVESYRLIGYENRLLAAEDFDDDSKDAGELGSGHTVTALYEIVPKPASSGSNEIARVRLRYKEIEERTSQLLETLVIDEGSVFESASLDLQFSAAVAEYGMLLRDSKFKGSSSLSDVLKIAQRARGIDLDGYRGDFMQLVESTAQILDGSASGPEPLPVVSSWKEGEER